MDGGGGEGGQEGLSERLVVSYEDIKHRHSCDRGLGRIAWAGDLNWLRIRLRDWPQGI